MFDTGKEKLISDSNNSSIHTNYEALRPRPNDKNLVDRIADFKSKESLLRNEIKKKEEELIFSDSEYDIEPPIYNPRKVPLPNWTKTWFQCNKCSILLSSKLNMTAHQLASHEIPFPLAGLFHTPFGFKSLHDLPHKPIEPYYAQITLRPLDDDFHLSSNINKLTIRAVSCLVPRLKSADILELIEEEKKIGNERPKRVVKKPEHYGLTEQDFLVNSPHSVTDEKDSVPRTLPHNSSSSKCNKKSKFRIKCSDFRYTCYYCSESTWRSSGLYSAHMRTHADSDHFFPCPHSACSYRGNCVKRINNHFRRIHEVGNSVYTCRLCPTKDGNSYSTTQKLSEHVKSVHKTADGRFKCSAEGCCADFSNYALILTHVQKDHLKIGENNKEDSPPPRREVMNYVCRFCAPSKKFSDRGPYLSHIRTTHCTNGLYYCPHCEFSAESIRTANRHLRSHLIFKNSTLDKYWNANEESKKEKQHECTKCHLKFWRETQLISHMQRHADKEILNEVKYKDYPYRCSVCKYGFMRSDHFKKHSITHAKISRWMCKFCPYKGNSNYSLMRHLKSHFRRGGPSQMGYFCSQIPCSNSEDAFLTLESLQNHFKVKHPDVEKNEAKKKRRRRRKGLSTQSQVKILSIDEMIQRASKSDSSLLNRVDLTIDDGENCEICAKEVQNCEICAKDAKEDINCAICENNDDNESNLKIIVNLDLDVKIENVNYEETKDNSQNFDACKIENETSENGNDLVLINTSEIKNENISTSNSQKIQNLNASNNAKKQNSSTCTHEKSNPPHICPHKNKNSPPSCTHRSQNDAKMSKEVIVNNDDIKAKEDVIMKIHKDLDECGTGAKFTCPICPFTTYAYFKLFQTHCVKFHPEKPELLNISNNGDDLSIRNKNEENGVSLICGKCGYQTGDYKDLEEHSEKEHRQDRKHKCPNCNLGFKTEKSLKDHVLFIHHSKRRFPCPSCHKKFPSHHHLTAHKRAYCFNKKKQVEGGLKCEICSKVLSSPNVLTAHMNIHKTERIKVTCRLCGQKLTNQAVLRRHIQRVHLGIYVDADGVKMMMKKMEDRGEEGTTSEEVAQNIFL